MSTAPVATGPGDQPACRSMSILLRPGRPGRPTTIVRIALLPGA
jgi:hypothetical protein